MVITKAIVQIILSLFKTSVHTKDDTLAAGPVVYCNKRVNLMLLSFTFDATDSSNTAMRDLYSIAFPLNLSICSFGIDNKLNNSLFAAFVSENEEETSLSLDTLLLASVLVLSFNHERAALRLMYSDQKAETCLF